ncbi:MAG: MlaD family protein [Candidatus Cloacimonetes bacterium]|nr:MlaD family protein [Candidatus Cloacimonadota bacterium]
MVSKAQKFRLGVFVAGTTALLILLLVLVVGRQMIEKKDIYYVRYTDTSVNGLQIGGSVKYNGILIGAVDEIRFDEKDVSSVIVQLSVYDGTPIHSDMRATLVPVGITGLKSVEITGGTNTSPLLNDGDFIDAGTSTFDSITGKAEVVAEKLETVLNNIAHLTDHNNREKFDNILKNVDEMIIENRDAFNSIVNNVDSLTLYVSQLSASTYEAMEKINRIIDSEEVVAMLKDGAQFTNSLIEADVPNMLVEISSAISQADALIRNLNNLVQSGKRDILPTLDSLRETMDYLNEFARQIGEEPSMLLRTKKK